MSAHKTTMKLDEQLELDGVDLNQPTHEWEIQFAYRGKTRHHWRTVATATGSERQAEARAVQLFVHDEQAVDLLVIPANREELR